MESISFFHQPTNLNEICTSIVRSERLRMYLNNQLCEDWDFLDKICTSTSVSAENLDALLGIASETNKTHEIMCKIVELATPDSFSDDWIDRILLFPDEHTRNSCLISLAHKDMPIHILKLLCATNCCFECYFSLIIASYIRPTVTLDEFELGVSLFLNSPFAELAKELDFEIRIQKASNSAKQQLWQDLIRTA